MFSRLTSHEQNGDVVGFFVCVFHADLHDFGVRVWKRQTGNVDLKIEPKSSFGSFHPQMKSRCARSGGF